MGIFKWHQWYVVRLVSLLVVLAATSTHARAESFVAPASGALYVKCVGGSAGATSQFGTGTSQANFVPYLSSLPGSCPTSEVSIGSVRAGQTIPFGVHTVWQGIDYWAFSNGSDQASTVAFSDVYNSLRMGGKIIQQTGPNTWVIHVDDAAHYTVDFGKGNNLLIEVRLVVDESPRAAGNTTAINGRWSATVADSKATSQVDVDLIQNSEGQVVGDYSSSQGGKGKVTGAVVGTDFTFELTQTAENCPGIFKGKGVLDGNRIVGSYTGSDCLGDRGIGTLTMSRAGVKDINQPIQTHVTTSLPPLENGPLTVTAIAYRIFPHYRETRYQLPGHSNTSCFGSGTYMGGGFSTATANCSTTTTPPQEIYGRTGYVEIFNQVESNGIVFTLRCTARWYGSSCSSLTPGATLSAEVKGNDMWITGHRGNMGKEIHAKYQMLDRRPKT
jgi:hypothetical protein